MLRSSKADGRRSYWLTGLLGISVATLMAGVVPVATAHAATVTANAAPATTATKLAVNPRLPAQPRGIAYRAGVRPSSRAASASGRAPSTNPECSPCDPPLLFASGTPVMSGLGVSPNPGQATITPIFWAPSPYTFSASYKSIIDGYLTDVAAASGTSGNVFGVATEYYQNVGAGNQYIHYTVHAGTEVDVSDPFPAQNLSTGCVANSGLGYTDCVADPALHTEVQATLAAHGLPVDDAHLYMVFFPPNVETCEGFGSASTGQACSSNVYCGYHSAFDDGGSPAIYANMPYAVLNGCGDPFNGPQAPNGNSFADTEISIISHEANESITDWAGAWFDANGFEDGDECAYTYGIPAGSSGVTGDGFNTGTAYNQVINGHFYYTQDEFSNAAYAAGVGDVNTPTVISGFSPIKVAGCLQTPGAAIGSLSADAILFGSATDITVNGSSLGATAGTATLTPDPGTSGSPVSPAIVSWSPSAVTVTIASSQALGTYALTLTTSSSVTTNALTLHVDKPYSPLTPVRLFDTRTGTGGVVKAPVAGGHFIPVHVAGVDGVPANATTVALNVTAVNATVPTYVTVWPGTATRPNSSNLNPNNALPVPNFDIVSIGPDGNVDFYNSAGSVNLLADIAGYYIANPAYTPQTPVRLFDTRTGTGGVVKAPVAGGHFIPVHVAGVDGVPANATAVALNVTAVNATVPTYVTVWPGTATRPNSSNLNPNNALPVPNFDIVSIGPDGNVDFYNSAGSVNLLADIAGYYIANPAYTPQTPVRLFDTRTGTGGVVKAPVAGGHFIPVHVAGVDGVPANATTVALNVTAVNATVPTYVTVWPGTATRPNSSNLNPNNALPVPNFDIVSIGPDGNMDFYNSAGSVNLLADIAGYFS